MNRHVRSSPFGTFGFACLALLAACADLGDSAPEEAELMDRGERAEPQSELAGTDQAFKAHDSAANSMMRKVLPNSSTIRVCLQGGFITAQNRATIETSTRNLYTEWRSPAQSVSSASLMPASNIVFTCSTPDLTIDWSSETTAGGACVVGTPGCRRPHATGYRFIQLYRDNDNSMLRHELGHIFGLADTYVDGSGGGCQPGQPYSVMCNSAWSTLQEDDMFGAQEVFCLAHPSSCRLRWSTAMNWCLGSSEIHMGDFNADGRTDMLCHEPATGYKWVALATNTGKFNGTHWSNTSMSWCGHPSARLLVGDLNGDGRADMLCHDAATGAKWTSLATTSASFNGTTWSAAMNWCTGSNEQVKLGDFNGDKRADMLCHDRVTGTKAIAFATSSGTFTTTGWSYSGNWCTHSGTQLFVGDFNGDSRSDLLCHDAGSGAKWVALAQPGGTFNFASAWHGAMNWCFSPGQVFIGDFNNDHRDDMLCHEPTTGQKWTAFAGASGDFPGTSRYAPMKWCNHSSGRMFVGDFDRDGRDDFLCHDVTNGAKWIGYQYW